MAKRMKPKNDYVVKTMYGDTEEVTYTEDGSWVGQTSGKKYDENEFISFTKVKGNRKEKGE